MGFQVAELFVDLTMRDANFMSSMSRLKASMESVSQGMNRLGAFAERLLLGEAAVAGLAIHQWALAERSTMSFSAALGFVGENYAKVGNQEEAFFKRISNAYVIQAYQAKDLATLALSLGVSFKDLNEVVEIGIGLGDRYFGGDSAQGVRALTLAQQGNLRQVQLLIPEMKRAGSAQEALTLLTEKGREGLALSEARADSFVGKLQRMWVSIKDLAQSFGGLLAPQLEKVTGFVTRLTKFLDQMSDSEKSSAIHITEIGAAILGVVAIAPKILSVFQTLWQVGSGLTSVVLNIGKVLFAVITGPIGGFVLAIGVAAAATIFFAGTGDTLKERMGSGLSNVLQMGNVFLGGWKNIMVLWNTITTTTGGRMAQMWTYIVEGFKLAQVIIKTSFENLLDFIETATMVAVNKLAAVVNAIAAGPAAAGKILDQANKDADKAAQDLDARMGARVITGSAAAFDIHDDQEKARKDIADSTNEAITDLGKQLENLPTVSDQLKGMIDEAKKKSGMDDFVKKLQEIVDQFGKIKLTTDKMPTDETVGNLKPAASKMPNAQNFEFKSLADEFKQRLAGQLLSETTAQRQLKVAEDTYKVIRTGVDTIKSIGMGGMA